MFVHSSIWLFYRKQSNRMIRSGECFLRVHNYPLAFKTKFRRRVPQEEVWAERFKQKESRKASHGVLKRVNFPAWFTGS